MLKMTGQRIECLHDINMILFLEVMSILKIHTLRLFKSVFYSLVYGEEYHILVVDTVSSHLVLMILLQIDIFTALSDA